MSENNEKYLDVFPGWLKTLGADVQLMLESLKEDGLAVEARRMLTGGINYLFKSLDLVPDGIDDIGYLDDAFVLRVASRFATEVGLGAVSGARAEAIGRLGEQTGMIEEFLGKGLDDRFKSYVRKLSSGAARGRSVDDIMENPDAFAEFTDEAESFIAQYSAPAFSKDEKNLVKLKAFFDAKLPK